MSQQMIAVCASSPVKVELASTMDVAAIGAGFIHEMNLQRYVAQDSALDKNFIGFLSDHNQQADIWFGSFSPELLDDSSEIQPFGRSIRGISCLFSMLGDLPGIGDKSRFPIGDHWPVSCADQERAFCMLMERLHRLWSEGSPTRDVRLSLLADYAGRLRRLNEHSFMFWDGEALYVYSVPEDGLQLAYRQCKSSDLVLDAALPLRISTDEESDILIVGTQQSLGDDSQLIGDGHLMCFSQGTLYECLEPVSFWSE